MSCASTEEKDRTTNANTEAGSSKLSLLETRDDNEKLDHEGYTDAIQDPGSQQQQEETDAERENAGKTIATLTNWKSLTIMEENDVDVENVLTSSMARDTVPAETAEHEFIEPTGRFEDSQDEKELGTNYVKVDDDEEDDEFLHTRANTMMQTTLPAQHSPGFALPRNERPKEAAMAVAKVASSSTMEGISTPVEPM